MADVQINSRQIAALAHAAAEALDEARQRGRLPPQARFGVRIIGVNETPTLEVVLEDADGLLVANGYRVA